MMEARFRESEEMNEQEKEIIASKSQLTFYKECYKKYGYEIKSEYRNKNHFHYTFVLEKKEEETEEQKRAIEGMEQRLRIIEVIDQKKRRYFTLVFNLLLHAGAFCIQAILFEWLGFYNTHPAVMLRVGVVVLQIILVTAFIFKIWEILRWNATQKKLKEEILYKMPEKKIEIPNRRDVIFRFCSQGEQGFHPR